MAIHPVGVSNSFARHGVFWILFLPLLSIIFFPVLMSDQNIAPSEIKMVSSLGVDTDKIFARTNSVYSTMFIKTGLLPVTEKFFTGDIGPLKHVIQGQAMASHESQLAGTWIRGVWELIYKAIWRMNMLVYIFVLPMIVLCVPSAVDGFMVRARKKYQFENYNPVFFYASTHTAVLIIGLFVYLPILPFALNSFLLAGFLIALAAAIWTATSNFQTGST